MVVRCCSTPVLTKLYRASKHSLIENFNPLCLVISARANSQVAYPVPKSGIDWKSNGFRLVTRDTTMVVATHTEAGWGDLQCKPYGVLSMEPAATILNYGQGLFEGLKAYRTSKGRVVLFRPELSAKRMQYGSERLMLPQVPVPMFLKACSLAFTENADWVPPVDEGGLYLRCLYFGNGPTLGVRPSTEFTFVIFVSPTSNYYSSDGGVSMKLVTDSQRAAPLGIGNVKYCGNYAQCFKTQKESKAEGFADVIYLDVEGAHIEEGAASNFFCVDENNNVHTPELGTILPGMTRQSIIEVIQDYAKISVHVGPVRVADALKSKEVFVTGTGAGIVPVSSLTYRGESFSFGVPGAVTQRLQNVLEDIKLERDIKHERIRHTVSGWLYDPFLSE